MLVRRNEKTGGSAGRVDNGFVFFGINYLYHKIYDVPGGAELAGVMSLLL
jgi:hypothetical protein